LISTWPQLKSLALGLNLPEVTLAHPWGHEVLKAHGRMWCYWAALTDGAPFKVSPEEREMLLEADPETFFLHPHYTPHGLILVRAGRLDPGWAKRTPDPAVARRRPETLAEGLGRRPAANLTQALSPGIKYPRRRHGPGFALFRAKPGEKPCGDQPLILKAALTLAVDPALIAVVPGRAHMDISHPRVAEQRRSPRRDRPGRHHAPGAIDDPVIRPIAPDDVIGRGQHLGQSAPPPPASQGSAHRKIGPTSA
jgi:hypothetical protein